MKKNQIFKMLVSITMSSTLISSVFADTYNPETVYNKGDETTITINGIQVPIIYLNNSPSSTFTQSTPYDANNSWLWSVSANYKGEWVPFHYTMQDNDITVLYAGNTYKLLQEMWPTSASPSVAASESWGWECVDCKESSANTCPNAYSTDYYPISLAQQNNGADNTSPANASGNGGIVAGQGGNFININQLRSCNTPLALYNNDIYFRDACDPHSGIGYYGVSDNTNVPAPEKRLFADTDMDGPVLYGFGGGALGIRQRNNLNVTNGPHIEKIALQWTPSTVFIGSQKLPMLLTSYNTIAIKGLTGSKIGFSFSGTEKTRAFSVTNTETNDVTFSVFANGTVNAKKIYAGEIQVLPSVNGLIWPDYVFDKNYKLRSIVDLKNYISENNHLPDVPSAQEIENGSMNVAEMNVTLLRKVEELTLYILDLQQQINQVNTQMNELK